MLQLLWTPIADRIKNELTQQVRDLSLQSHYVAIIYCGDNQASATYVHMKQKFAQDIGLELKIFGQDGQIQTADDLLALAWTLASDPLCIGYMPQLPLPLDLKTAQFQLFDTIPREKDIDGLGSHFIGKYMTNQLDILGATPQAVMTLLDEYGYGDLKGKKVSIVWQSNLIGKPLLLACIRRGATVYSFNSKSDRDEMRYSCLHSDVVISCTGVVHLIDETFFRDDQTQVAIDVGRWFLNGKAVGDITLDTVASKVAAYTPIPWGVWPLTIASLLYNALYLYHTNY